MTDPSGRDLLDEQMDRRLQEYGARWRDALPEPAASAPAAARPVRRWLPPAAAAAVVVVLAGVTYAVASTGKDSAGPTTNGATPTIASDDRCGPGDLVATDRLLQVVSGTAFLSVRLTPAPGVSPCLTNTFPEVTLLDHGEVAPVRTTHAGLDPNGTTVISSDTPAVAQLVWTPAHSCAGIDNDAIRIRVGRAEVEVEGFGPTGCADGDRERPVRVNPLGQVTQRDTSHDVSITGTVTLDGGPAGNSTLVTSGVVALHRNATGGGAQIGPDGTFELELPPGSYAVTVSTPQWNDGEPYRDGRYGVTGGTPNQLDIHIPIK